jgi:class 3 adenylate cyclase
VRRRLAALAAALLADPDQAALGGSLVEVTALFADLRGFTTFSEGVAPGEIVTMLNRYHGVAVPSILDNGGTIVQFVGDALLALFNAPARQDDHEARAVRAALRDRGVLVGVGGVLGNVVRVQPPLSITADECDRAVTELLAVLKKG